MNRRGMTLIEVMFAAAIFTVVMGVIIGTAIGFGDTAEIQEIQATSMDEAQRTLQAIVPDIRQAVRSSINWDDLPGEALSYSVAADLDGNGTAVDIGGRLEMSVPRVIARDLEDLNDDGFAGSQLIAMNGSGMRVLANNLSPESEQPDDQGDFGLAQDLNGNGRLDRGIWFEPWGRGLRITIQTQGETRQGHVLRATFQEVVFPRN